MDAFSRILVAVDGSESSEKVFDIAAQLCKLSGGKLYVVHVVIPLSIGGGFDYYYDPSDIGRLQDDMRNAVKGYWQNILPKQKTSTISPLKQFWPKVRLQRPS